MHAQGLDCRKPSSAVARTVCGNADLRARDEQLAEAFGTLVAYTPRTDHDALKRTQSAWLAERDRTCDDKAKAKACTALYEKRSEDVATQSQAAQKRLASVAAGIPKDPKAAAGTLQRYDGAAAKAWLVYLYHTGTVAVPDKDAEIGRLTREILERDLTNDRELLEEMRTIGDVAKADTTGVLLFLRHALSTTELDAPCFLFTKHGLSAFEAFGPFWGGSRDDTPELCHDVPSIYDLPEWKKLAALMEPTTGPGPEFTIRSAYDRQFAIDTLQASMAPGTLLEAPRSPEAKKAAEARDKAVAAFRGWKDHQVWPEAQQKAAAAALPSAIAATSKLYQENFKLPTKTAEQAARAAADRFIAGRMAVLVPEDVMDDE
ncbi:lysozyme inhibitor LprI family protein [Azospirillum sp.]|uniref:lysozyme inhibitor LprI family protein n=1 Tax=Azospirillum sp. TaxID=34012 RepID=UPI003D746D6B